jgi:hypothetical protein
MIYDNIHVYNNDNIGPAYYRTLDAKLTKDLIQLTQVEIKWS